MFVNFAHEIIWEWLNFKIHYQQSSIYLIFYTKTLHYDFLYLIEE